jgi:homoserine O-succinyltransferase
MLELANQPQLRAEHEFHERDAVLDIGLVNNMPDAALRSTERQFRTLLAGAAQGLPFRLMLYSLPDRQRTDGGWAHIHKHYEDVSKLWGRKLDGLIVTGAEPSTWSLEDEPYWRTLVRLADWAEDNTISTIWLCLAAHATVLHLDGVQRRPFRDKLFGVFECMKTMDHPILSELPPSWRVPHSRHNDLPERILVDRGYSVLSRSADVGADIFVKHRRSLFLFAQGHPEYDAGVLLREYRRDISRFLSGEKDDYPELPRGYFDEKTATALCELRARALRRRDAEVLLGFPATADIALTQSWQQPAQRIYANWLCILARRKAREQAPMCKAGRDSHAQIRDMSLKGAACVPGAYGEA